MMTNSDKELSLAIQAALTAGAAILEIYDSDFSVEHKADKSPLTLADKTSHEIIKNCLQATDIPLLSEEGRQLPFSERRYWNRLWIVDPLDGTKEFVKRNGEFTVNVALAVNRQPVLGVIYVPVKNRLYFGMQPIGAYRCDDASSIEGPGDRQSPDFAGELLDRIISHAVRMPLQTTPSSALTIIGSRSHVSPEQEAFVEEKRKTCKTVDYISAGSSLKFCLVAEGRADVYPRFGPTMEWDTAAGQAIAELSGACVLDRKNGKPLMYNKKDLHNPSFIVERKPGFKTAV